MTAKLSSQGRRGGCRIGIFLFLLLLAGCSPVQVGQDYRLGADFSGYHTFGWRTVVPKHSSDIRVNNPLLQERFRGTINKILVAQGYSFSSIKPDFLVSYDYSIATKLESVPDGTAVGFGFGRYYRYGGIGFGAMTDIRQYDVGTLVIDFYDGATGAMIWRGTGSQIVTTQSTPQDSIAFVDGMVGSILAQFPPH